MYTARKFSGVLALSMVAVSSHAGADGDATNGEQVFNGGTYRCYTCHSLNPGEHKIGPSLARLFGRKAGSAPGFEKYSEAMVTSGIIWDEETLDEFLADTQKTVPGNNMMQEGYFRSGQIPSAKLRADVIAYLKRATAQ